MYLFMLALFVLSAASVSAQVTIGSTDDPHANAILDLKSTNKGLLLPNVELDDVSNFKFSKEKANIASAKGMMVFNTNADMEGGGVGVYVWDGQKWLSAFGGNGGTDPKPNPDGTVDQQIGKNTYKTYDYNGTVWMVQNSMEGTSSAQMHNGDPSKVNGYYYTYDQAAGACPAGWHLPTQDEWEALKTWVNANKSHNAAKWWITDAGSAFAGDRSSNGTWYNWGTGGLWWSAGASYQRYDASTGGMNGPYTLAGYWFSVRCVKDDAPVIADPSTPEKIGNNIYKTYDYDGTVWMVQNSMEGTSTEQMYDGDNTKVNGYYYSWNQATKANNACPTGWHLPSAAEWNRVAAWVNANMTDPAAQWWVTAEGGAFAGMRSNATSWNYWGTAGGWWCSDASDTFAMSSVNSMSHPGVGLSAARYSVRCVKN